MYIFFFRSFYIHVYVYIKPGLQCLQCIVWAFKQRKPFLHYFCLFRKVSSVVTVSAVGSNMHLGFSLTSKGPDLISLRERTKKNPPLTRSRSACGLLPDRLGQLAESVCVVVCFTSLFFISQSFTAYVSNVSVHIAATGSAGSEKQRYISSSHPPRPSHRQRVCMWERSCAHSGIFNDQRTSTRKNTVSCCWKTNRSTIFQNHDWEYKVWTQKVIFLVFFFQKKKKKL